MKTRQRSREWIKMRIKYCIHIAIVPMVYETKKTTRNKVFHYHGYSWQFSSKYFPDGPSSDNVAKKIVDLAPISTE